MDWKALYGAVDDFRKTFGGAYATVPFKVVLAEHE